MTADQPTLVDLPPATPRTFSERHIQSVAAALHARWGPCDTVNADDCDGATCHVTFVREVLEESAKTPVPVPADRLDAAVEEAWRIACCYGELIPDEAKRQMSVPGLTPHMALSRAHMWTVVARIAPILAACADGAR
jgi:hypothetical protein